MTKRDRIFALHFGQYLGSLMRYVSDDEAFRRQALELMRNKMAHDTGKGRAPADVIVEIVATCATKLRLRKHRALSGRWYVLSAVLIRMVHEANALGHLADAWKGARSSQLENALRFSAHLANDLLGRIQCMGTLDKPTPETWLRAYFDTVYAIARHLEAHCLTLTKAGKRFNQLTRKTRRLFWKIIRLDPDQAHRIYAGEAITRLKRATPSAPRWTDYALGPRPFLSGASSDTDVALLN